MKTTNQSASEPLTTVNMRQRHKRVVLRAAIVATLLTQTVLCLAQSPTLSSSRRRDLELRPGVVIVEIPFKVQVPSLGLKCSESIQGSGFLYRPDGYLITNGHVVQLAVANDAEAEKARLHEAGECLVNEAKQRLGHDLTVSEFKVLESGLEKGYSISPRRLTIHLENGTQYDGSVKAYSPPMSSSNGGKDVAIIKIDANNLPTVPLGDSSTVNDHDPIFVLGYPGAAEISATSILTASGTDGIISAVKAMDNTGTPLLQTNASINHGNSGGPAFDAQGNAIGIATLGSQAAGFNFLVPINTAMEFVHQAGAQPDHTSGLFDKTWHDALDAYAAQKWTKAHALASSALEMMPNQPEVMQLQLWASANERSETAWQRATESIDGIGWIAGGSVLALVLIGTGVLLTMRSRSRPTQPAAVRSVQGITSVQSTPRVIESSRAPAKESFGSLLVSRGQLSGNRFSIPKAGLLIGRDPERCAVVIPGDAISGEHAWVVPLDNGVAVIDRNSTNGTYINSTDSPRVSKMILRSGDRILLGRQGTTELVFSTD